MFCLYIKEYGECVVYRRVYAWFRIMQSLILFECTCVPLYMLSSPKKTRCERILNQPIFNENVLTGSDWQVADFKKSFFLDIDNYRTVCRFYCFPCQLVELSSDLVGEDRSSLVALMQQATGLIGLTLNITQITPKQGCIKFCIFPPVAQ